MRAFLKRMFFNRPIFQDNRQRLAVLTFILFSALFSFEFAIGGILTLVILWIMEP